MSPRSRWIAAAGLAVGLLFLLRRIPMEQILESMRSSIEGLGIWGPVAFGLLYAAATVLLLPGSILTLAAGALFGPLLGTATVSVASVAGAALAFLISRYFVRERVVERMHASPKLEAVDRAIGEGGWKIVGLLRLSPAIPFNLSNYLYGVTSIPFGAYVLTSWIAMLPATFMYVYFGAVAASGVEAAVGAGSDASKVEFAEWALRLVGLAATVAVTVYITRLAKKALAEQTDIENSLDSSGPNPVQEELPL